MAETQPSSADLAKLVFQDELTELYNRRYLNRYLTEQIDWQSAKNTITLLMIDVDFFKEINDNYGHLEGDKVLKQLGKIIRETIGNSGVPIRYAGDEFTIILPGTNKASARTLGETLRQKVDQMRLPAKDKEIKINISLGAADFPADGRTPEELIDAADKALYYSKRQGKNRVSIAGEEDKAVVADRDVLKNFPPPNFIGREKIRAELKEVITAVKDGNNAFVLVESESGSGKTRLLKEVTKLFGEAFGFFHTCLETELHLPYRPVLELLTRLLPVQQTAVNKIWPSLSPIQQAELKKLLPTLPTPTQPVSGTEITAEEKRRLIFEGLTHLLTEISETQPLLILLDVFQNVDEGTLEIINCLNESDRGRVLTGATVRAALLENSEAKYQRIDNFLNELAGTECFRHIPLPLFDRMESDNFIAALLPGYQPEADFNQKVFDTTRGNPLFIEETVKHFILKQYISRQNNQWVFQPIPAEAWHTTAESVIHDNLMLLDKTTVEMVNQASVAGLDIDFNLLKSIGGKNEGEIMDLLDKAKNSRLIEASAPLETDRFGFVNQRVQEVTYQRLDANLKQNLHQGIAQAAEQTHKDNPDLVSYHYAQAGDKEQAERYAKETRTMAAQVFNAEEAPRYYEHGRMIIRSKIKEAVEPLSDPLMKGMRDILRALSATAKNMRLYPEGSQLISQSSVGLLKSLETIFVQSEKITFSEVKNTLNINTVSLDAKTYGASVTEFLNLLKDHYIKSCTLRRGVTAKEVETLLKDLDNSPTKSYSAAGYWNKFLEEKNITNIGISQRAYTAVTTGGAKSTGGKGTLEVTPTNTPLIKDVLRYFTAAQEDIKLYPSGSQITTQALKQLHQVTEKLFAELEAIELSEVEDRLLFNGVLLNPRIFGLATQSLAKIIKDNKMKSITIKRNCAPDEIEKTLRVLNNPTGGVPAATEDWNSLLNAEGIVNVVIGETTYTVADLKKGGWRKTSGTGTGGAVPGGPERASRGGAPVEGNILNQTERLLQNMPDKLVSAEFIELTNKLAQSQALKQLINLVDRFIENFKSNRAEMRTRALAFYAKSFERMSDPVKEYLVDHGTPILLESIKSQQSIENHGALLEAVYQTASFYIVRNDYEHALALVTVIGRESDKLPFLTDALKQERWKTLARISQNEHFAAVIKNLQNPAPQIQAAAFNLLAAFKDTVAPVLVEQVKASEQFSLREALANLIRQAGGETVTAFANEFKTVTDTSPLHHLLSVLTVVAPPEMNELIAQFLKHPDALIREEAFNAARKLPKETALAVLTGALKETDQVAIPAAKALAELGYREAADAIIGLFERSGDKGEICRILGKLAAPQSVPFLIGLLYKKGFLGLWTGYPDEIRGAAAWALGQIKTPETTVVLEKALKDKSPQVRSAAKLGLNR